MPLSFAVYFWTVVGLAVIGISDSIYLFISHHRVYTDIGYKSFCAISRAINCDTVSQSPYSIFLGLPVAVWGVIGYAVYLLALSLARRKDAQNKRIWPLLFLVSLFFSLCSVMLAFISTYLVRSYCILCILSFGVNFALLFYTWLIRRRFGDEGFFDGLKRDIRYLWVHRVQTAILILPLTAVVVVIWAFIPAYWHFEPPVLSAKIGQGITADGHPWIGAENPKMVISEFSDYQCFQCKKMHYYLRQIIAEHPEKIRLIHRHYPMDHEYNWIVDKPFHIGSGAMALLGIYAASKGKFWEMNDALFEIAGEGTILLRELANRTGLDFSGLSRAIDDPRIRFRLKQDIWRGMKLRIYGTPAFTVDGILYYGQIPPEELKRALR